MARFDVSQPHAAPVETPADDLRYPDPPAPTDLTAAKLRNYARYVLSIAEEREVALNTPLSVFLETANACNLKCVFCASSMPGKQLAGTDRVMQRDVMGSLGPVLPGLANLALHGFGEPLLNRHLVPAAAAGVAHRASVGFFTNGMLLSADRIRLLVGARVPGLTVSISSADKATYERLYAGGSLDRLTANLRALRDEKARVGSSLPHVVFNAIVMRSTLDGLPGLVRYAAEMGVDAIAFKPMVTYDGLEGMHGERICYDPARDDAYLDEVRRLGAQLGVGTDLQIYLDTARQASLSASPSAAFESAGGKLSFTRPCSHVFSTMYVQADGGVKPCCFAKGNDPSVFLGNAKEQSLLEIWNGPAYRRLRRSHLDLEVPPHCRHCVQFDLAPKADEVPGWLAQNGFQVVNYEPLRANLLGISRLFAEIAAEGEALLRDDAGGLSGRLPETMRKAAILCSQISPLVAALEGAVAIAAPIGPAAQLARTCLNDALGYVRASIAAAQAEQQRLAVEILGGPLRALALQGDWLADATWRAFLAHCRSVAGEDGPA